MTSPPSSYRTFPKHESFPMHSPPNHPLLLTLLSIITVGSHYGKHSLASLGPEIMTTLDISRLQFAFLFSSQALPGIILPLVGGFALTYVPHGPSAILLSLSITCATTLCAIAVSRTSYILLFLGRLLFGLADGALTTLQGALVAHWFRTKVGSSFGSTLFVSRLSSFLGLSLPAYLSQTLGLQASMWISVAVCIPPFLATVAYTFLTSNSIAYRHLPPQIDHESEESTQPTTSHSFIQLLHSFVIPFWLICYLWIVVAGCVFPVTHFASDAFSTNFQMSPTQAGLLAGTLVLTAGLTSPLFGIAQDRIGRRPAILAASCAALLFGLLSCACAIGEWTVFIFTKQQYLALGITLVAIGFSAAPVTLLSSLVLVVDDYAVAAALGLYKASENAGLTVLHASIGALRDESGNYVQSFLALAALAASGILAAIWLGRKAPVLREAAPTSGSLR